MFSEELIRAREREHLSKRDLAALSGVSYKHIDNMEAGRRPPTLPIVKKLDKYLHFPTRILVRLIRDPDDAQFCLLRRAGLVLLGLTLG